MFHSKYYNSDEIGEDLRELHECLNKSVKSRIGNDPGGEYKEYFMLQFVDMLVYYIQNPKKLEELYTNTILNSLISKSHTWIQKYYDKGAYIYEDQRLVEISGVLKNEITVYFNSSQTLLDIVDIIVFLMKEDIYYRARWIPILQDIRQTVFETAQNNSSVLLVGLCRLCETCKDYQLSAVEQANVQRWH